MTRLVVSAGVCQIESLEVRALLSTATISTVAGSGARGFAGDGGLATSAALKSPLGTVVDSTGNLFFADQYNLRVREVVKATGNVITVAGNGGGGPLGGYTGDGGQATAAQLSNVSAVALDGKGNLYIGDFTNHVVRQVNLSSGIISTVAGKAGSGAAYVPAVSDGLPATSVELGNPAALAVDSQGNLFISDSADHLVLKVDAASHTIRAVVGNGTSLGVGSNGGDGGAATDAQLSTPRGLAFNSQGDLFIADMSAHTVRKVDHATGKISTVAGVSGYANYTGDGGQATAAKLYTPQGVAVDAQGNLFIADTANNRIREVDPATGVINTVVGNGTLGFSGDGGSALDAQLNNPQAISIDSSGNLFVTDTGNQRIRVVAYSASTATATTTRLVTSSGSSVYGQSVTYTATVSPNTASGQTAGGKVQFTLDGVNYGAPVALSNNGQALLTLASLGAGTHTVGASYTGDSNFQSSAASNLSQAVSKAVLVVTANPASGRAGDPLPPLSANYAGFVNGDTLASLTSAPTLSTSATQASVAGSYPISVVGGAAKNYTITPVAGTLTLAAPIKPTSVKGVYSGTKLTGLTITFNGAMNAASLQTLARYVLVTPGKDGKYGTKDDGKAALVSAVYKASTNTVTLKLKAAVASTPGLQLKGSNLLNSVGGLLDGAHNGKPGSILTATFKGKTVTF